MLTRLAHFWSRLTTSRYTRALEDEISRLRAENRALVNSILGIAGIPPLRLEAEISQDRSAALRSVAAPAFGRAHGVATPPRDSSVASTADTSISAATGNGSDSSVSATRRAKGLVLPVNPLRRRSWQQIGRMLEIEDARRLANRDNSDSML